MSKDGRWTIYTGEEAAALKLWQLEREEWHEAHDRLAERLKCEPEMMEHLDTLETRLNGAHVEFAHVIHARLVRVLPHLADVITYLLFTEWMPMPEFITDERGLPDTLTYPFLRQFRQSIHE